VVEAVNADLEPLFLQTFDELVGDDITVLRYEVPRRPVAAFELDLKQLRQLLVADLCLDVVCEHQSPRKVAGPKPDEGNGSLCDAGNGGEEEIIEVVQGRLDRPARKARL
jgi:hypothetical protein